MDCSGAGTPASARLPVSCDELVLPADGRDAGIHDADGRDDWRYAASAKGSAP
jgi:hypothetical protein